MKMPRIQRFREVWLFVLVILIGYSGSYAFLFQARSSSGALPPWRRRRPTISHLHLSARRRSLFRKRRDEERNQEQTQRTVKTLRQRLQSRVLSLFRRLNLDNTSNIHQREKTNQASNRKIYRNSLRRNIWTRIQGFTVYVLECEHNKWYVGSTLNRRRRYWQHLESDKGGSKWTRLHKPIRVYQEYKRVPPRYSLGLEAQVTAEYMLAKGVNNVRGAMFTWSGNYTLRDLSSLVGFIGHYNALPYGSLATTLRKELETDSLAHIPEYPRLRRPRPNDSQDPAADGKSGDENMVDKRNFPRHGAKNMIDKRDLPRRGSMLSSPTAYPPARNGKPWKSRLSATQQQANAHNSWKKSFPRSGMNGTRTAEDTKGRFKPVYREDMGVCFNCGKSGHKQENCPENVICFNCGETGHVKANCPNPPKCFLCGEIGHTKANCSLRQYRR